MGGEQGAEFGRRGRFERAGDQARAVVGRQPEGDFGTADLGHRLREPVADRKRDEQESDQVLVAGQRHDRGLVEVVAEPPVPADRRAAFQCRCHQRVVGQRGRKRLVLVGAREHLAIGIEQDRQVHSEIALALEQQVAHRAGVGRLFLATEAGQASESGGIGDVLDETGVGGNQAHGQLQLVEAALFEFALHRGARVDRLVDRLAGDFAALHIGDEDGRADGQGDQQRHAEEQAQCQRHRNAAALDAAVNRPHSRSFRRVCRTCSCVAVCAAG